MYPGQQNQQGSQSGQQQYQAQPGYPPQPAQQPAPQAPAGPAKDAIVADEFKKYAASVSWQVSGHQQTPGQHIIKLMPSAGRKLVKGDVKKAQLTIKAMGPGATAAGAQPSGANSIEVSLDTEEKKGLFGSDRKSYPPLWLNADEEVDGSMQPTAGLRDKIRNLMTLAKIMLPPPVAAPQPPAQPPAQGAPSQPPQPGAAQTAPPQAGAPPAQSAPQYQPQTAPQQYGAQAPAHGQRPCPNPNCRAPNAANAVTCYRCGFTMQ